MDWLVPIARCSKTPEGQAEYEAASEAFRAQHGRQHLLEDGPLLAGKLFAGRRHAIPRA